MLKFQLRWTPSASKDVVGQEVRVKVNDGEFEVHPLGGGVDVLERSFADNDAVEWYVRTVDDAGNVTDSEVNAFTATDVIPPQAASGLNVVPTGEDE